MKRYLPLALIAGVLFVVIASSFILIRSKQRGQTTETFATQSIPKPAASPAATASTSLPPVPKQLDFPAGVSVTLEEFGDYQCPPCGRLHPELKSIEHDYGKRVNLVFRNLPLTKIHKNALIAAQAAEAARLQDHFQQMHDRLYESQDEWKDEDNPRPTFIRYAGELGLNTDRFDRDMDGPAVKQRLTEDQQRADSLGVQGTPTVFVEDREMKPELTSGEGIRKGINYMLARKAGGQ